MKSTPNRKMEDASSVQQKDKMAEGNRRGLWVSHASLNGADFAGRGRSFQVVWRTDLKVDLERTQNCEWSFWPISKPNDYPNLVFNDVISLCGSCRNSLQWSLREKL